MIPEAINALYILDKCLQPVCTTLSTIQPGAAVIGLRQGIREELREKDEKSKVAKQDEACIEKAVPQETRADK
jgi:hypothetical protein